MKGLGFPVGEGRKGQFGTGSCSEGAGEVAEFDWELGGLGWKGVMVVWGCYWRA